MPYLKKGEVCNKGFADFLFKEGEYYRAITEFYRLLYNSTDSIKKVELIKNIGLCHFHGADYEGYISFFKKNEIYFKSNHLIYSEMNLCHGKSYYYLKQYLKAIAALKWNNINPNNDFVNETQLLLGISYARLFDWQSALKKLHLIKHDSLLKISAKKINSSLKNFPELPKRDPLLAGTLSAIIPGTGYFYCNRKGTGLTSFIVNGLIIWTIRDAIIQKQYGLATAASFLGMGWYIGNVKGSYDAAKIYNRRLRDNFINTLLEKEQLYEYIRN